MQKIASICWFKAPYGGNFIEQLKELSYELNDNDLELVLIFPEKAAIRQWCQELMKENFNVLFLKNKNNPLSRITELINILRSNDIRLVHSHFGHITNYLIIACKVLRIPHIYHSHADIKSYNTFLKRIKALVKYNVLYRNITVILLNYEMRIKASKFFFDSSRLKVIPNALNTKRLMYGESKNIVRRKFGIGEDKSILLMMGYDVYIKGVDLAVKAIDSIKQIGDSNDKIRLAIVVASNRDKVVAYIKENFYGEIPKWIVLLPPNENIGEYYRMADIFFAPSRTEGLSYAMLEALYMGLPIIASDISGNQWAKEYEQVRFFEGENIDAIVRLVIDVIEKHKKDNQRIFNLEIEKRYSKNRWNTNVIQLYQNQIGYNDGLMLDGESS